MVVKFTLGGSTNRTRTFLQKMRSANLYSALDRLASKGVTALQSATPMDSGLTAASWDYEIATDGKKTVISWTNTNQENGAHIAILLQYGHATGTGGYVSGRDYINPAIQPVFDEIANEVWKKVTSS